MPQQDVELNEVALGGSSSQSESSSSSSSSSSSNGGSGDSGKKKHSKLCLILCIVIPVVVVVVVVVVLVVVLTGKTKSATCTKDETTNLITCTGGKLTKDSFTGEGSGFKPATDTEMDIGTFDGEIDPEAFDAFVALAEFKVDPKNTKYNVSGKSLVTRKGQELVRVPQAIILTSGEDVDCTETDPTTEASAVVNTNKQHVTPMATNDTLTITKAKKIRSHALVGVKGVISINKDVETIEEGAFGITYGAHIDVLSGITESALGDIVSPTTVTFLSASKRSMATDWNKNGNDVKYCAAKIAEKVTHAYVSPLGSIGSGTVLTSSTTDMEYHIPVTSYQPRYVTEKDDIAVGIPVAASTAVKGYSVIALSSVVQKEVLPIKASDKTKVNFVAPIRGTIADLKTAGYLEHSEPTDGFIYAYFLKEDTYIFNVDIQGSKQEYYVGVSGEARSSSSKIHKAYAFPAMGVKTSTDIWFAAVDLEGVSSTGTVKRGSGSSAEDVTTEPSERTPKEVAIKDSNDKYFVSAFKIASAAATVGNYTVTFDSDGIVTVSATHAVAAPIANPNIEPATLPSEFSDAAGGTFEWKFNVGGYIDGLTKVSTTITVKEDTSKAATIADGGSGSVDNITYNFACTDNAGTATCTLSTTGRTSTAAAVVYTITALADSGLGYKGTKGGDVTLPAVN